MSFTGPSVDSPGVYVVNSTPEMGNIVAFGLPARSESTPGFFSRGNRPRTACEIGVGVGICSCGRANREHTGARLAIYGEVGEEGCIELVGENLHRGLRLQGLRYIGGLVYERTHFSIWYGMSIGGVSLGA